MGSDVIIFKLFFIDIVKVLFDIKFNYGFMNLFVVYIVIIFFEESFFLKVMFVFVCFLYEMCLVELKREFFWFFVVWDKYYLFFF